MATSERNNKILLDLVQQPGNNLCADCGAPDPDWASYTLGVFVCLNCSGMHRNLPAVSKVKSIRLDHWEDSLVEFMQEKGNSAAKAIFEKCVPVFFYQPQQKDCVVLKDQWIRAKYERREFTGENIYFQKVYSAELFEATLWKKGKDSKQFFKSTFLLSQKDFTLRYFIKEDVSSSSVIRPFSLQLYKHSSVDSGQIPLFLIFLNHLIKTKSKVPKAVINMKDLNAVFQPEKIGHATGLQISYVDDERSKNLFVYHKDGQVIVSFFNAIRATRLAYLLKKNPTLQEKDLKHQLTAHCLKEGYMEKTGPTQREPFKKRWFTLCSMNRKLLYFKSPLDATELGAVFIGTESHGYSVSETSSRNARGSRWHCGISLETPERQFVFMCEQEQEQSEWIMAFRKVISQPMTPEDYSNEANLRRGK
ncbi:arf-GAP with dual PH domain-containing protein 2 isoform X1 [Haplochromis burtoni]|uniref:arf-GAP with dual PH domain-containing protein 2 isoform X1 n=1 Tax=Haplochromis burtoni TaxID=8153 RepID=UPI001C2D9E0C|nr:arf-GAP with dual PH domain-containing protein 2 isoform X1 [Haplochromis burtoni]